MEDSNPILYESERLIHIDKTKLSEIELEQLETYKYIFTNNLNEEFCELASGQQDLESLVKRINDLAKQNPELDNFILFGIARVGLMGALKHAKTIQELKSKDDLEAKFKNISRLLREEEKELVDLRMRLEQVFCKQEVFDVDYKGRGLGPHEYARATRKQDEINIEKANIKCNIRRFEIHIEALKKQKRELEKDILLLKQNIQTGKDGE